MMKKKVKKTRIGDDFRSILKCRFFKIDLQKPPKNPAPKRVF